jgi:hydrogenase maturation protease
MRSLVSMHVLLGAREGEFVSSTDVPEPLRASSAECHNTGLWPALIGTGNEHDTMLAAPIILYDYPQLAPESPGELFDSTEIDEILTLRILTLTDDEKREAASIDPRARDLLARSESLAQEQLMNLHGTMRGLRPVPAAQEQTHG